MIIESSRDPSFLSNTWLIGDRESGHAVLVDAGAPTEPIEAALARDRLTLTHVLLTHAHGDHTVHADVFRSRHGARILAHRLESIRRVDRTIEHGERVTAGDLDIEALHVPGHTAGQLAFHVSGLGVFTGDTLFRGTVGGTRGPGHTTLVDLKRSILDTLLRFPEETTLYPGHMDPTTVGDEIRSNPFVRLWQGRDRARERRCIALGRSAALILRAPDYDGGTKCQVRWDDGTEDVVAGSRVNDD